MRANSKTGGAPGNRGLRVSCDYNQGFSAFLSVSADVGWVIARAVWPQEGAQVQLQFEPHVDQKVKKQVPDQSWYLQSDRGSTSDCTVVREGISVTVTVMGIRW